MHVTDRTGIRESRIARAIGVSGNERALRTARSLLIFLAVVATFVGFIALVAVHHARPEIIVMLAAAGLWLGSLWYVERRSLDRELQQTRVRLLDARDRERLRVQRDLHDSAQQRLISVRIHLGLLADAATSPEERQTLDELGRELEDALADIRSVTRAGSPELLARFGVPSCLRSAASTSPVPVMIEAVGFGRLDPQVEQGVYYCCLEALQNVIKHAGPNAAARIRLRRSSDNVTFEVEDSGRGFDPARVERGEGLTNLADRLAVMRGRLAIDSRPGMGTRIFGEIPIS
ncbi:MAG TPA: ATP-binding protein [Candidatus Limnocylindrales bacterium]|nr:ATP-binding protein [Candidatus Limnocylindrales bacterium]